MDSLERAVLDVADRNERGDYVPPKVWTVGKDAAVDFGPGRNPFDGATFTCWSVD